MSESESPETPDEITLAPEKELTPARTDGNLLGLRDEHPVAAAMIVTASTRANTVVRCRLVITGPPCRAEV